MKTSFRPKQAILGLTEKRAQRLLEYGSKFEILRLSCTRNVVVTNKLALVRHVQYVDQSYGCVLQSIKTQTTTV